MKRSERHHLKQNELASSVVRARGWAEAGATWWIESMWDAMGEHSPVTAAYDRLRQGPPASS